MRFTKIFVVMILTIGMMVVLLTDSAIAENRLGTAGAQELRIPFGSRGTAMGGSAVSDATGIEAIYWNPAGMAKIEKGELMFSYLQWIADINYYVAGGAMQTDIGTVGLSFRALDLNEDIPVTTVEQPEGTGETYNPTLMVMGVTYANQLTDFVSAGGTVSVIHENIHKATASAVSFDFGIQYQTPFKGLSMGLAFKNFGTSLSFDGSGFEQMDQPPDANPDAKPKPTRRKTRSDDLPTYVQFGVSYQVWQNEMNMISVQPSFRSNSFSGDEITVGVEYAFQKQFFLRAGYMGSDQDDYLHDFTMGAGVKLGNFALDYSYGNVSEYFDSNQWYTLKFMF